LLYAAIAAISSACAKQMCELAVRVTKKVLRVLPQFQLLLVLHSWLQKRVVKLR